MKPELIDYSRLHSLTELRESHVRDYIMLNSELAMVRSGMVVFGMVLRSMTPPFIINDYRFGIVVCGEADININLVNKHVTAGTMVFMGPGTIMNGIQASDDFDVMGLALFNTFPLPFPAGQLPSCFNGEVRDFQICADKVSVQTSLGLMTLIWDIVRASTDYNRPTVSSIVAALMVHYDAVARRFGRQGADNREQTLYDRFIYLVSRHAMREHQIDFYAGKMCLSVRYLGTVIRQTSGSTAKQWIDRALVTHIEAELRHSDKSLTQIADEMNFPNTSFFSKFFRRMTGMSPLDYRRGI